MANTESVIVYTTPTCRFCGATKEFLADHGVSYEEINVAADSTAAEAMIEKSGQMGVPVVDFRGEIVVGFDKPKLSQLVSA